MKFDDIDSYIESLFQQPPEPPDGEPDFDDRLQNVEDAILDAYENAMRWHSNQITKGEDGLSSVDDSSNSDNGYPYWGDCGPNG